MDKQMLKFGVGCILAFMVVMCLSTAHAAEKGHIRLIGDYVSAVRDQDKGKIVLALADLKNNKEALAFMKKQYPRVYRSYFYQDALVRLLEIQQRYGQPEQYERSTLRGKTTSKRRSFDNSRYAINQSRRTNAERVRSLSVQDRVRRTREPIGRLARRSPNQERTPNSTRSVRRNQR